MLAVHASKVGRREPDFKRKMIASLLNDGDRSGPAKAVWRQAPGVVDAAGAVRIPSPAEAVRPTA
jgi:hypothetical protein